MTNVCRGLLLLLLALRFVNGIEQVDIPRNWIDLEGKCLEAMRLQVQAEIDASFVYMAMGAHFSRDIVNRPGFAEMFFKASKEEREHATKLTEYLSMRGKLIDNITELIKTPEVKQQTWASGVAALTDALNLETNVTKSIRAMVKTCEHEQQYHLVDYLTGVFLEEQLHGERELAGKLVTLKKLMNKHGVLGEFLFDLDLLDTAEKKAGHF